MDEQTEAAIPDEQVNVEPTSEKVSENVEQETSDNQDIDETKNSAPLEESAHKGEKNKFQDRINEVTKARRAEERRANDLQRQLDDFRLAQPQNHISTPENPPTLEDFDFDDEKFMAAKISHEVKKQTEDLQGKERQRQQIEQRRIDTDGFRQKVEKFKEKATDYQEVVNDLPELPDEIFSAILKMPDGPQIAYHLATHLDVADELVNLPVAQGGMLLGKISSNLSNVTKKVKLTNAPEPIQNLKGSGGISKDYSKMSVEDICNLKL